jgi:hypothetical protein
VARLVLRNGESLTLLWKRPLLAHDSAATGVPRHITWQSMHHASFAVQEAFAKCLPSITYLLLKPLAVAVPACPNTSPIHPPARPSSLPSQNNHSA